MALGVPPDRGPSMMPVMMRSEAVAGPAERSREVSTSPFFMTASFLSRRKTAHHPGLPLPVVLIKTSVDSSPIRGNVKPQDVPEQGSSAEFTGGDEENFLSPKKNGARRRRLIHCRGATR